MAIPEHVEVVGQGAGAIEKWQSQNPGAILDLREADLRRASLFGAYLRGAYLGGTNLSGADLRGANLAAANIISADLSNANLERANLEGANLFGANLERTDLSRAKLANADASYASFNGADLRHASFFKAILVQAKLIGANLSNANLIQTNLEGADLRDADLSRADVSSANLSFSNLGDAKLAGSYIQRTLFVDVDLSTAKGLIDIVHKGPSYIDQPTLSRCGWQLPQEFLRGCGFAPWEALTAKLYDPNLTPVNVADLQQEIFDERTTGFQVGAMFISYSRSDGAAVDKLSSRLFEQGLYAWVDIHDATSGPLQPQIHEAIDRSDVVLLVLSERSIDSEWVKHEVKRAHRREIEGQRNVLCPIALDDTWKSKMEDIDWEHLGEKNILDFSDWESDEAFDEQFRKMLDGMKLHYGPESR